MGGSRPSLSVSFLEFLHSVGGAHPAVDFFPLVSRFPLQAGVLASGRVGVFPAEFLKTVPPPGIQGATLEGGFALEFKGPPEMLPRVRRKLARAHG